MLSKFIKKVKETSSIKVYTEASPGWKKFWIFYGVIVFIVTLEIGVFFTTKDGLFYIDYQRMENPVKEFIPIKDIPFFIVIGFIFYGHYAAKAQSRKLTMEKNRVRAEEKLAKREIELEENGKALITLSRPSSRLGYKSGYSVFINGEMVTKIYDGEQKKISVKSGVTEVQLRESFFWRSGKLNFKLDEGGQEILKCGINCRGLGGLGAFISAIIFPHRYLYLELNTIDK